MQKSEYITDARALADLCVALAHPQWVAIDTEFMRERTYFARPCLVQLATPEFVVLVDPIADLDIRPLLTALQRDTLVKVLHSARQDLELFHDLSEQVPGPVFDTQVASAFLGYDDQVSYAALVEKIAGVTLDKSQTRTDWAARPLRPEQLRYAEADVTYLRQVYLSLRDELAARGRLEWVEAECRRLERIELYRNDPAAIHLRLKNGHQFTAETQTALRALLAWREQVARTEDLPRNWVARDNELTAIARSGATDAAAIADVPDLAPTTRMRAPAMQVVLRAARAQPATTVWPIPPQLDTRQSQLLARLSARVRERATATGISVALLATRRELERLVVGERELPVLEGWRREVVGEELLSLAQGGR